MTLKTIGLAVGASIMGMAMMSMPSMASTVEFELKCQDVLAVACASPITGVALPDLVASSEVMMGTCAVQVPSCRLHDAPDKASDLVAALGVYVGKTLLITSDGRPLRPPII